MKVIAGLGNPGPQYEVTRHNAGFLAIDRLIDRWSAKGPKAEHQAQVWRAEVALDSGARETILLVKPQTYMNESGRSLSPLLRFYRVEPSSLTVIHDEVDLKPLSLRLKTGGGTAGHNGLKSIDAHLGPLGNAYHRIRIGIGKPGELNKPGQSVADHVLEAFSDSELELLGQVLDRVAKTCELILNERLTEAMTFMNTP